MAKARARGGKEDKGKGKGKGKPFGGKPDGKGKGRQGTEGQRQRELVTPVGRADALDTTRRTARESGRVEAPPSHSGGSSSQATTSPSTTLSTTSGGESGVTKAIRRVSQPVVFDLRGSVEEEAGSIRVLTACTEGIVVLRAKEGGVLQHGC